MEINIDGKTYQLAINNYFGPLYQYQVSTGETINFNESTTAVIKFIHGALLLNNDDYTMTMKELLRDITDEDMKNAITYANERLLKFFATETESEGEEKEKGEE